MADITMCQDNKCAKHELCYRAQATANPYRQSYFMWNPELVEQHTLNGCEYFWPLPNEVT